MARRPLVTDQRNARAHIANVALRLFAAHGYEATSVQTIADAAGVSKPTLYYYFGSKNKLYEHLVQTGKQEISDAVEAAVRAGKSPQDKVWRAVKAYLRLNETRGDIVRFFL